MVYSLVPDLFTTLSTDKSERKINISMIKYIWCMFCFTDGIGGLSREPTVQFKEVSVKQLDRSGNNTHAITGYWNRDN